mgnify:CR=1 FL=1
MCSIETDLAWSNSDEFEEKKTGSPEIPPSNP